MLMRSSHRLLNLSCTCDQLASSSSLRCPRAPTDAVSGPLLRGEIEESWGESCLASKFCVTLSAQPLRCTRPLFDLWAFLQVVIELGWAQLPRVGSSPTVGRLVHQRLADCLVGCHCAVSSRTCMFCICSKQGQRPLDECVKIYWSTDKLPQEWNFL